MVLIDFLFVLPLLSIANAQKPEFIAHPASVNIINGTTVEFTCTANNNPSKIYFLVNGSDVSADDEEKGFMELAVEDLGGGERKGRLLVTASVATNNSQIACQLTYNTNSMLMGSLSDTATLLVQGPLSSVADLFYSFNVLDCSHGSVSWSPPSTLPGTNITGYNVSVTSNGTTTKYFTSESYHVLLLTDITDSPCNEIIITVSGYNGLDGENESLNITSAIDNCSTSVAVKNEVTIFSIFNISDFCDDNYPETQLLSLFINTSLHDKNNTADGRVFVYCVFAPFIIDKGCKVELLSNDSVLQYTETFNRSSDSTVASGCISGVIPGVYTVRIFEKKVATIIVTPTIIVAPTIIVTPTIIFTPTTTDSPSESFYPSVTPTVVTEEYEEDDGGISARATLFVVIAAFVINGLVLQV